MSPDALKLKVFGIKLYARKVGVPGGVRLQGLLGGPA